MGAYRRWCGGLLLATGLLVAGGEWSSATAQASAPPANLRERSLLIMHDGVIGDVERTTSPCKSPPALKAWSFGKLMQDIAGRDEAGTSRFLEDWLRQFRVIGRINDEEVLPRDIGRIWDPWSAKGFDLKQAPFELMAIVNRLDLFRSPLLPGENAGEIRFVFAAVDLDAGCTRLPFTVILEYGVRQASCADLKRWAASWTDLATAKNEDYLPALAALTDSVTRPDPRRAKPNGSAIDHVRTNEIAGSATDWQMREFRLDPAQGNRLVQDTVTMSPRTALKNDPVLIDFLKQIDRDIASGDYWLPRRFPQPPNGGLLGATATGGTQWPGPSTFALNTCGGCHAGDGLAHIDPRSEPPAVSPFLAALVDESRRTEVPGNRAKILKDVAASGCAATQQIRSLVH